MRRVGKPRDPDKILITISREEIEQYALTQFEWEIAFGDRDRQAVIQRMTGRILDHAWDVIEDELWRYKVAEDEWREKKAQHIEHWLIPGEM